MDYRFLDDERFVAFDRDLFQYDPFLVGGVGHPREYDFESLLRE
jgi:hypothetical protein